MATFGNLTDRLADTFKNLRGKGKPSEADVDRTVREIRRALLDELPVHQAFWFAWSQFHPDTIAWTPIS